MSTEVAEETVAYKMDEGNTQTEEQTMPEEPSLAEDGGVADNDESTVGSQEQERRERRRNKRKEKKRKEDDDDDTYFSTSNETHKKEDGMVTKAIDRFVDLLNPVEKDMDEDETLASASLVSETTTGTTPTITKQPKPSLMQQLDKHVLTRFGCSSNPAYIPEDEEVETPTETVESTTEAKSTDEGSVPAGDISTFGANSILNSQDPGDPGVQLKSLDEENSDEEAGDGARSYFCGAVPLRGERGDSNVMSEITEEKKVDDEQSKGIMYSPSQLEDLPFDQQPPKATEAEPEAPAEKSTLASFTDNISPMFANIRSKVFPQSEDDESPKAGDADPAQAEGETIFEEAAVEGHEVPTKDDDEPSEQGEEVPALPEEFERKESEMPFDEAAKKAEEEDGDDNDGDDAKDEEEKAPEEESPKEEAPEEAPKEEIEGPAPVPVPSEKAEEPAAKPTKQKKKKKSIFGKIFKKKTKKGKTPKESILVDDSQKGVSPSEQLVIPEEPAAKQSRPAAPVDTTVTNQSKRESWKSERKASSSQKESDAAIEKTDSADFDLLLSSSNKNAANDDWDKLTTSPTTTPTKSRPVGSSSSPSGVTEFPSEKVEI